MGLTSKLVILQTPSNQNITDEFFYESEIKSFNTYNLYDHNFMKHVMNPCQNMHQEHQVIKQQVQKDLLECMKLTLLDGVFNNLQFLHFCLLL